MTPELQTKILETNTAMSGMGWCTPDKALHLARLVLENNVHTVVELGIFGGRSIIPMAQACQHQGFGVVWGIDPWTASAALEGSNDKANDEWWEKLNLESVYRSFVESVLLHGVLKECRWIRCKSEEAARLFEDVSIGLIHLDANHSEETSCRDVDTWLPKLKPNGVFIMDDAHWPTQQKAIGILQEKGGFKSFEKFEPVQGQAYMVFKR